MYRFTTRRMAVLTFLVIVLVVLPGVVVSAGGTGEAARDDGVLRVAIDYEPRALNPHLDPRGPALFVMEATFEGLIRLDHELNVIPWLAKDFEQIDELTWRFYLEQGVQFHSGNPFNAEAVKASYDIMLDPESPLSHNVEMVDEVVVIDEYTVEFRLNREFGPFVRNLAIPHTTIIDAGEYHRLGPEQFGINPSGTGAFRFVSLARGENVVFERNPNYWQEGLPQYDGIEFLYMPDDRARINALEAGEVDLIFGIPPQEVERLEANPDVYLSIQPGQRPVHLHTTTRHPILGNRDVRVALAMMTDWDLLDETILGAAGARLNGPMPDHAFGSLARWHDYDPQSASDMLRRAGWSVGSEGYWQKGGTRLRVEIIATGRFPRDIEVAEAVQMLWAEQGVDAHIRRMEYAAAMDLRDQDVARIATNEDPQIEIYIYGAGVRTGDVGLVMDMYWKSNGSHNATHFASQEFDRLLAIGESGAPESEREAAYQAALEIVVEQSPTVGGFVPTLIAVARNRLRNYRMHPTETAFWESLELD